jgi:hypothetical protein
MSSDGTVNARIVDSVATNVTLMTGQSPSQAFGMLDTVMAETLGMAMHNAVLRQQAASMIGSAAVTATCARMLQAPSPAPFPRPPIPPPPVIDELKPPPPTPPDGPELPEVIIAMAGAEADAAVEVLQQEAKAADEEAQAAAEEARSANHWLAKIAQKLTPQTPPNPPPPPAPPPNPLAPPHG